MVTKLERLIPRESNLFSLKEVVSLDEHMAIAYGAWGEPVDNQELIKKFVGGNLNGEIAEMIKASRINVRHHTLLPELREREDSLVAEDHVEIGARLTRESLRANGWEKADLLVVAVSTPPCDDFEKKIAERAGLTNAETRLYCLACNGAIAALHDILRDDELKDSRVVITAVEELSRGVNFEELSRRVESGEEVDIDMAACAAIFGNGAASLAFSPKNIELLAGKTVIVPDKKGVILLPKRYALPEVEGQEPPDWYDLGKEGADKLFSYTPEMVIQQLPETDFDYIKMKGVGTAIFFAKHVPPVVRDVLGEYYQQYSRPVTVGISHQPSGVVWEILSRRIKKILKGLNNPAMEIPWVLDMVGMGNVSSATTFLAWAQLEKEGRLPKGEPFNITGFGVGASVTSMVVRLK